MDCPQRLHEREKGATFCGRQDLFVVALDNLSQLQCEGAERGTELILVKRPRQGSHRRGLQGGLLRCEEKTVKGKLQAECTAFSKVTLRERLRCRWADLPAEDYRGAPGRTKTAGSLLSSLVYFSRNGR